MHTPLEQILLRRRKAEMIQFMNNHPKCFEEAMELAVGDKDSISWRTAWMVSGNTKKNDPRIKSYIHKILEVLPDREDGHQRELFKILLKMNLTEDFESVLFDLSVDFWEQVKKQSSVRCYAFQAMVKVANKYPELKSEVNLLAQPHYLNSLSSGIRKSLIKNLKSFEYE